LTPPSSRYDHLVPSGEGCLERLERAERLERRVRRAPGAPGAPGVVLHKRHRAARPPAQQAGRLALKRQTTCTRHKGSSVAHSTLRLCLMCPTLASFSRSYWRSAGRTGRCARPPAGRPWWGSRRRRRCGPHTWRSSGNTAQANAPLAQPAAAALAAPPRARRPPRSGLRPEQRRMRGVAQQLDAQKTPHHVGTAVRCARHLCVTQPVELPPLDGLLQDALGGEVEGAGPVKARAWPA
jgi:hypothetical protein